MADAHHNGWRKFLARKNPGRKRPRTRKTGNINNMNRPRVRSITRGVRPMGCYNVPVLLLEILLTLVLLVVCCFAPGFYFVRRFAWSGLEKLCGSIALSLTLV